MNLLTDEEINALIPDKNCKLCFPGGELKYHGEDRFEPFARAIEAAVLEKVGKVDVEPVCWHEPGSPHNEPVYNNVTGHKKWALINGWQPLYTAAAIATLRARAALGASK